MKEVKILFKSLNGLNFEKKVEEFEKDIEKKLNEGFEIKSSNFIETRGNAGFVIYVILERVV